MGQIMSYLEEFKFLIKGEKLANFLRLWEEYCMTDEVDSKELKQILHLIKDSNIAVTFGQFAETILPLWKKIEEKSGGDEILRLILDLQTMNSPLLADLATDFLKRNHGQDPNFNQKFRLVGLVNRKKFQGAISNFELLTHMEKGNFVFHTGGWGVGEIVEFSLLREHVLVEFEETSAIKDLSFENAFKHLIPLSAQHFLARRFGNPDSLEKEAKEDPIAIIKSLLKDLGPKTAQEIKEELSDLVIPENEWAKWWQATRAKIKKDTIIQSPQNSKEPFILAEEEVSHESRVAEALKHVKGIDEVILLIYNSIRDFPEILKNRELKEKIKILLLEGLANDEKLPVLSLARKIQISFLLEDIFPDEFPKASLHLIKPMDNLEGVLQLIEIVSLKKRTLMVVREHRKDWITVFLHLMFVIPQTPIKDYIFKELSQNSDSKELLKEKIQELLNKMTIFPEAFFWYFQKIENDENVPFNTKEGKLQFLEALLILLHFIEDKMEMRDLVKKIQQLIYAKRYEMVRLFIKNAPVAYLEELLLLASKCQTLTKHDQKILHSLAEVAQPSMGKKKKNREEEEKAEIIWTTQEGYQKIQDRIKYIGTVETVDNAKEIEAARALGDLRENAEYKFALERRSRLQAELHALSKQINKARILTKNDILKNEVSVGSVVNLSDSKGNEIQYTLLGPWDADPEKNILSFQSKLAQAMLGSKKEDSFDFQGERYTVKKIESFLEKKNRPLA